MEALLYRVLSARLELLVYFDLVTVGQAIVGIGQADHRHHLVEHLVGHALLARRNRVRRDAVRTAVSEAYRQVDQLLHHRVERSGRHQLLGILPGSL